MKRAAYLTLLAWLITMAGTGFAQEWMELREEGANFYDIQRSFYQNYEEPAPEKGLLEEEGFEDQGKRSGYTQFKRWEYFMEPRVYPSGELPKPGQDIRAFNAYLQRREAFMKRAGRPPLKMADWASLGPTDWEPASSWSRTPGQGRITAIAFHPVDPDTIFLGTPAGGLWQSTDGGTTWNTDTDDFPVLGVSSIVIDPLDPDVMYLATGDNDKNHTSSVGVLKTLDGGVTWNPTDLAWEVDEGQRIYKMIMHPTDSDILLAATTDGIYRTTDGGTNWEQEINASWKDIEFKPGDPTVVYAAYTTRFYRSADTGDSWARINLPGDEDNEVKRLSIAVSPDEKDYVYLLASRKDDGGFLALYRSTDSGLNFTTRSTAAAPPTAANPNILGYNVEGDDAGGQGSYTLALAVSPSDADVIYTGGVNIWSSSDGGLTWNNRTYWKFDDDNPEVYVHADVHHLEFHDGALYIGTDGGLFRSDDGANTFADLSAGLTITQFYRIGGDPNDANRVFGGAQDNAFSRFTGDDVWDALFSGDGMECIVDYIDPQIVYVTTQSGNLKRSDNGGATYRSIKPDTGGEGGNWATPYVMDPISSTTLYAGYVNVWKTTDRGASWMNLSNGNVGNGKFDDVRVATSDPDYLYGTKANKVGDDTVYNVYRTTDGGVTWSDVTAGLPAGAYSRMAVASNDPEKIWITLSGYQDGKKVYASTDGGDNWANVSGTLPNLPFNTIVHHDRFGDDVLYVGADVGVYYRDSTMADWELYQTGLPNVRIQELEVHENSGMLRAATFGRGLWETPLAPPAPGAALAFDGVDDYVSIPAPFSTAVRDVTMEAWVKWDGTTGNDQVIFYNGDPSADGYGLILRNDQVNILFGGIGAFDGGVSVNLTPGTWTHVALTAVGFGRAWRVSKDGVFQFGVLTGPSNPINTPTTGAGIGGSSQAPGDYFNGAIDEFRFWNETHRFPVQQATMNCELTGTEVNLVAYYQFNQGLAGQDNAGETVLIDIAGGDTNGTLNNFALDGMTSNWIAPGGVVSGTSCLADPGDGAALAFDGVDDYVSMPTPLPATDFTMEAWVKWDGTTGMDQVIFYNGDPSADGYGLVLHNDQISALLDGVHYDTGVSLTAGTWTHLALTNPPTQFWFVLMDGVRILQISGDPPVDTPTTGAAIGAFPGATNFFKGTIDEVRLWSPRRTRIDVQDTMNCEVALPASGLIAYYKFNQGLAGGDNAGETTLIEAVDGINNGTLNNFALNGASSNWVAPGGVVSGGVPCTSTSPLTVDAGDDNYHSGGATKLRGSASGGSGTYTYAWTVRSGPDLNAAQFSDASARDPVFIPTATGAYRLSFTINDGVNPPASDEVEIGVNGLLTASISGPDPVDPGSLSSYTATSDATDPTYLWIATNGSITEDPDSPPGAANTRNPVLVEAGGHEFDMLLEVYVTDGVTSDVVYALKRVSLNNPFALSADAGADGSIPAGASTVLGGSPTAIGGVPLFTYEWAPVTALDDPSAANPVARPATTTTYTVTVADDNGSVAFDHVTVTVTSITDAYENLLGFIAGMDIDRGLKNALAAKVRNSKKSFERGNANAAVNQLNAFIHQVEAQRGKQLTDEQADALIAQAQALIEAVNAGAG